MFIKHLPTSAFPSGGRGTIGVSPMVDEVYQTQSYPKALRALPVRFIGCSRIVGRGSRAVNDRPYGFVRTKRRGNAIWCNASNRVKVAQSRVARCVGRRYGHCPITTTTKSWLRKELRAILSRLSLRGCANNAPRKCDLVQHVKSRESGAKPRCAVCRKKIRTVEDACPYGFVRTTRKAAWCGAEGA